MKMKKVFYFMLFAALLAGCSKDKDIDGTDGPDGPDEPETPAGVTLGLSVSDLVFEAAGGEKTFTITCSTDWTVGNESDWCTTDVSSGKGNRTVTVTARAYAELADRNTNLTVRSGGEAKVLTVTQKGKEAIILSKDKFEVPQEGGDLAVQVRSNVTYEVDIPEAYRTWICPMTETRAEVSDTTYYFFIDANDTDDSRAGHIVFSAGALQDTVRIYQAQKDQLVLTQREYDLGRNDTTITAELRTNVDYDVTIMGDAASWVSRVETRAGRVDRLQFHIEANTGDVLRTAKIAVQDKNGTLSDTLYIRQSDKDDPRCQDITADFDPEFAKVLQEKNYIPDATHIILADVMDVERVVIDSKELTSLKGIEHFKSLTHLTCYNNQLTTLDVSGCTALDWLECSSNQLTALDVRGCTALTSLYCSSNQLTTLDVSRNTALTSLYCSSNQLTTLDVSRNTALTSLTCSNNQLTTLDVSGCTALTSLYCNSNQLTTLDVSSYTALDWLDCSNNQLTALDVSSCTALNLLDCSNNQLTALDVSSCTALNLLDCFNNQLTTLDVRGCTALTSLSCNSNQLTTLDVSSCTALDLLDCFNNQLTTLNVGGCTALTSLSCSNNQLTTLDVSRNTALIVLFCNYNQLTTLDVSRNTALGGLDCSANQLTTLDVSRNTALIGLFCSSNQLTTLDVSRNTALTSLSCSSNQLTTLDVSQHTLLEDLRCNGNQLTTLDVSRNTALTQLWCYDNPGDGVSIFPVTAWFDNSDIPKNMRFHEYREKGKTWIYNGKTIRIDFRRAE